MADAQKRRNQWEAVDESGYDWNSGEEFDPGPDRSAAQTQTQANADAAPAQTQQTASAPAQTLSSAQGSQLPALQQRAANASQIVQQNRLSHVDTSAQEQLLQQQRDLAEQSSNAHIDRAVTQGVNELNRTYDDALSGYQTQRNQIDIDEARARDNQALYAAARGDRGGVAAEQYNSIMNTAATNRMAVNRAQNELKTSIQRQINELRANGEFQKSDAAIQLANQYLSQLAQLWQWAQTANISIDQFNASLAQWEEEYNFKLAELGLSAYQFEQSIGLQREQLAENIRQFNASFAENQRQFDTNLGFQREQLAENRRQFDTSLAEDQRQFNLKFDRDAFESDRAYELQVQEIQLKVRAYEDSLRQQAIENGWKEQEIQLQLRAYEDGLKQQAVDNANTARQINLQERSQLASEAATLISLGITPDSSTLSTLNISASDASLAASANRAKQVLGFASNSGGYGSYDEQTDSLYQAAAAEEAKGRSAKTFINQNYKAYGFSSSSGLYDGYQAWASGGSSGGMSYDDAVKEADAGRWSDAVYAGLRQRMSDSDIARAYGGQVGKSDSLYYYADRYNDYMESSSPTGRFVSMYGKGSSTPMPQRQFDQQKEMFTVLAQTYAAKTGSVKNAALQKIQMNIKNIWGKLSTEQGIEIFNILNEYGISFGQGG